MLMIGNSTPDLEVEALMPDGRFERLRLGALAGRWACGARGGCAMEICTGEAWGSFGSGLGYRSHRIHTERIELMAHTPETASLADPVRQAAELLPYPSVMPAETIQPPHPPLARVNPGDVADPLASGAAEMAPEFGVERFI